MVLLMVVTILYVPISLASFDLRGYHQPLGHSKVPYPADALSTCDCPVHPGQVRGSGQWAPAFDDAGYQSFPTCSFRGFLCGLLLQPRQRYRDHRYYGGSSLSAYFVCHRLLPRVLPGLSGECLVSEQPSATFRQPWQFPRLISDPDVMVIILVVGLAGLIMLMFIRGRGKRAELPAGEIQEQENFQTVSKNKAGLTHFNLHKFKII